MSEFEEFLEFKELTRFTLRNGDELKVSLKNGFLTFKLVDNLNTFHIEDIVRLNAVVINESKDVFSIYIHLTNGVFFQVDNMLGINKKEYFEIYTFLYTCMIEYNENKNK